MKKIGLFFSLLLCCSLVFSQTIFLDAGKNVPTDELQGQPVLSYSFGTGNEISLTLVTGIMTPELMQAAASGTVYSKMEIKQYDSQNKLIYKITLQNVMVAAISLGTNSTDNVTLQYDKMRIKDFSH